MSRTTATQRWVLGLSSAASFMVVLDMLVVATALSTIQRDLGASLADLEWTVNAYVLSFAVLLMTAAAVGDRLGRRRVFAAGLGLFALASAACALATSVPALVAARVVQGAGAALVMPLALALMNAAFPPQRRGWATGILGSVTGLAATLGPVIGGAVTEGLAWQWIFWINVPIGLVAIPLVLARTPESLGAKAAPDLAGLLLAAVAASGAVWALVRGNAAGWGSSEVLAAAGVAVAAGVGFVAWERRAAAPMLPPRLFRSRPFSAGNVAIFAMNATLTGAVFLTAQYFQVGLGHGPFAAGLRLLPWGLVPLLVAPWAGALADRFGERALTATGCAALAAGMGALAAAAGPGSGYASMVLPMVVGGAGFALAIPAVTRAVVSLVAGPDLAKASGAYSTLRQLGGAFGVAVLGAVFAGGGGYGSAAAFRDGYRPAMAVAAAIAVAGVAAGLALPRRRAAAAPRPERRAAAPAEVS